MAKRQTVKAFDNDFVYNNIKSLVDSATKTKTRDVFTKLVKNDLSRDELMIAVSDITGESFNRVGTIVDTGLSVVGRQRITEATKDLGLVWYKYIGGVIGTTRDFCLERDGGYYHQSEVESWADEDWEGKIEGTDSENIFSYCGGYNCRHDLIPVDEASVPSGNISEATETLVKELEETEVEVITNTKELAETKAPPIIDTEKAWDEMLNAKFNVGEFSAVPKEVAPYLSTKEADIIYSYTTTDYKKLSSYLKGEDVIGGKAFDEGLSATLKKLPGTEHKTLYRLEKFNEDRLKAYLSGEPIVNPNYWSTSYDKTSAFFDEDFDAPTIRLRIVIQTKQNGLGKHIDVMSVLKEEKEVLFPRGTNFKFVSYDAENKILNLIEQ